MSTLMIASQVGLWIVVAFLLLVVFALTRQVGLLHKRITPLGARMTSEGPGIGEAAPAIDALDLDGQAVSLASARGKSTLLVFVSAACESCADLMPSLRSLRRSERRHLEIVLLSVYGDEATNAEYARTHKLEDIPLVRSQEHAETYGVTVPPYAVLVGPDGLVKAKGLVNHLEHLESLLTAARLGLPSIDSYMRMQASA